MPQLEIALYGCVKSAALWADHIKATLIADEFVQNFVEPCCYNRQFGKVQLTVIIHVDDLLVSCVDQSAIDGFLSILRRKHKDIKVETGGILGYLGLSFDFRVRGEVSITAPGFTKDLLASCKPTGKVITPATDYLFHVRPFDTAVKASLEDVEYFHSCIAKLLYLGKCVGPEILTAVSFLTTRINPCDNDDMNKLARVLSYLATYPERGITLCIGESIPSVSAQIDTAYGVRMDGKCHTGCTITIGDRGSCYFRSAKQRIVTKSSTEAELVVLSDSANVPIHINRFLRAQGYGSPPAI
jgi:hypothetical protein